ncbi:hypothetical protein GCM10022226_28590 [Sphaerisporangium flaviroseum]|uniref:Transcriptional regulator n=1 Tax=Sphaerisporangium flaviroseum TaxID=509199 RepID=A0ABP7HYM0_9ACTN
MMDAYQQPRYSFVLRRVPDLLVRAQLAAHAHTEDERLAAFRLAALAGQSAAMILTKLGEPDLAWIAAQRGLAAAEQSEDPAVIGSLMRSLIHALHTHGRPLDAMNMTRTAADFLNRRLDSSRPALLSIYGTLLLPGAVAAARAGDRATAKDYPRLARRLHHGKAAHTDRRHHPVPRTRPPHPLIASPEAVGPLPVS